MEHNIETGTDHLVAVQSGGVLTLRLNRPEARNAITLEMAMALDAMLERAEHDKDVRCILLTGAGRGFCAGGDVKGMADAGDGTVGEQSVDEAIAFQRRNQRGTAGRLYMMDKPTIAALPGAAAGAGLALALACDLRIMVRGSVLTTAFANVGLSGDYGGTFLLHQIVGAAKARELYFLADRVSAEEAQALGLTNWVVEADELESRAMEIAGRLAAGPPVALGYMKENLRRAASGANLLDCMDLEATHHIHCGQTEDHVEAVRAFVDKRTPHLKGR